MSGTTKTYYWKIFGSTEPDISQNKYLDVDEAITDIYSYRLTTLARWRLWPDTGFEATKIRLLEGELVSKDEFPAEFKLQWKADSTINNHQDCWLQVKAFVNCLTDNFGDWNSAKFVIEQKPSNGISKWSGVSFQRCIYKRKWNCFHFEVKLEQGMKVNDIVQCYLWKNSSPDSILINKLELNLLDK